MARNAPPDQGQVLQLTGMVQLPKGWISVGAIPWVDAGGRPKGWKFREHLALDGGIQPATLFLEGYFKPASVPGAEDKLSLSLFYKNIRILGIDADGISCHRNSVGAGRPFYQQLVGHPHLHSISDDALYGYAEPIPVNDPAGYWTQFLELASVVGAPQFNLPPAQQELLLR